MESPEVENQGTITTCAQKATEEKVSGYWAPKSKRSKERELHTYEYNLDYQVKFKAQ